MEKRYQVFISSTFQDLKNARQEVSQALLRADCFPAGMELFPAADEEQFEFIKTIIDQSDYYIIISAGRYGTIHPETGLSYTEMEYDYAVETGKPVIRLLHKDPFNELKGEFIEKSDEGREKLQAFRAKMSGATLVHHWISAAELLVGVVFGLQDAQQRNPSVGRIRGDQAIDTRTLKELSDLREQVALAKEISRDPNTIVRAKIKAPITFGVLEKMSDSLNADLEFADILDAIKLTSDSDDDIRKSSIPEFKRILGLSPKQAVAVLSALELDGYLTEASDYYYSSKKFKGSFHAASVLKILES